MFRDALRAKVEKLNILFAVGNGVSNQSQMAQCGILQPNQAPANLSDDERAEVQFNAVTLTYILVSKKTTVNVRIQNNRNRNYAKFLMPQSSEFGHFLVI